MDVLVESIEIALEIERWRRGLLSFRSVLEKPLATDARAMYPLLRAEPTFFPPINHSKHSAARLVGPKALRHGQYDERCGDQAAGSQGQGRCQADQRAVYGGEGAAAPRQGGGPGSHAEHAASADVLLGKLGYGTVSECVDACTPFVFGTFLSFAFQLFLLFLKFINANFWMIVSSTSALH